MTQSPAVNGRYQACAWHGPETVLQVGQHHGVNAFIASGLGLLGTSIQFYLSLQQLDAVERDAFRTIDDWRTEVSWRRPIARRRHRRVVAELLDSNPEDAASFKGVWRLILSWTLLVVGAGVVFANSAMAMISRWV